MGDVEADSEPVDTSKPAEAVKPTSEKPARARPNGAGDEPLQNTPIHWWSKVWVPAIAALIGLAGGAATCGTAYLQRDVRNQVYEATYQDNQRALQNQSELLKLQEVYLGKLKQIDDDRVALTAAQDEVKKKEAEAETLRQQSKQSLAALRAQYGKLEAAENARLAKLNADKASVARRAPWKQYGCTVPAAGTSTCDKGYRGLFAWGTVDEKEVVHGNAVCGISALHRGVQGLRALREPLANGTA